MERVKLLRHCTTRYVSVSTATPRATSNAGKAGLPQTNQCLKVSHHFYNDLQQRWYRNVQNKHHWIRSRPKVPCERLRSQCGTSGENATHMTLSKAWAWGGNLDTGFDALTCKSLPGRATGGASSGLKHEEAA